MKLALVGTGFITEWLIEAARQCSDVELAAIVSRTPETAQAFARKHNIPLVYTDLDEVARNTEIDAVYIASPNAHHAPQSIRMMEAGKHVLCEKPVASNAAELEKMLDCAQRNGRVLLEGVRSVFADRLGALKETIAAMGQPRRAVLVYNRYSSRYDAFLAGQRNNTFDPALSNSALMDMGVYCVRLLVELFGVPDSLSATGVKLDNGFEASGTISAQYPAMTAELLYSKITNTKLVSEIQFDNGLIQIEDVAAASGVHMHRNGEAAVTLNEAGAGNGLAEEVERFVWLTQHPDALAPYSASSRAEMRILDEARRQTGVVFPADGN